MSIKKCIIYLNYKANFFTQSVYCKTSTHFFIWMFQFNPKSRFVTNKLMHPSSVLFKLKMISSFFHCQQLIYLLRIIRSFYHIIFTVLLILNVSNVISSKYNFHLFSTSLGRSLMNSISSSRRSQGLSPGVYHFFTN